MHSLLRDKDILVSKYEQKIKGLSQNTLPSNSNHNSSTSISPRRSSPVLNR